MPYYQPINIKLCLLCIILPLPISFLLCSFAWCSSTLLTCPCYVSPSMSHFPHTNTMMGPCLIGPLQSKQPTYPTQFMLIPITQTTLDFQQLNQFHMKIIVFLGIFSYYICFTIITHMIIIGRFYVI
jgi:hypothetical protein